MLLLTPRQLFWYAEANGLLDAPIRVCDGMAVSYFIDHKSLAKSTSLVLDVSHLDPIDFDDLTEHERRVRYFIEP